MKHIFRILLFIFCIINFSIAQEIAQEITQGTELKLESHPETDFREKIADSIADSIADDYETLDRDYVQFEITQNSPSINFSILKSYENLVKMLKSKYYSLLSWSLHTRRVNLQIENYDRKLKFGRWINDPNDNTCLNTRALVLQRDSTKNVIFKDSNHCAVASGNWNDPYTGQTFRSSADIQIDHFVPLKNAYMSGAYKWNFKTRCLYANFLGSEYHLLSVNGTQNMKKGDRAPDKYIPPNSDYVCTYIKNWLSIKFLWGLKMSATEADAVAASIKNNHCNTSSLYISDSEILRQSQFYQETLDLCEKLKVPQ